MTHPSIDHPHAAPRLAGLIGWPVDHSLSPYIHKEWARRRGDDIEYIRIPCPPTDEDFATVVGGVRAAGFAGVNVTLPHKERALKLADEASEEASIIGAANMLTFRDGRVYAHNSDAEGFAAALRPSLPTQHKFKIVILGAGGAARAIVYRCLRGMTPSNTAPNQVTILNRTMARAESLAAEFNADLAPWEARDANLADCDILINTTSLGMTGSGPLEISLENLPTSAVVFDSVYTPLMTPLLQAAKVRGNNVATGLDMLIWQAVPGFKEWLCAPEAGENDLSDEAMVDDDLRTLLIETLKAQGRA